MDLGSGKHVILLKYVTCHVGVLYSRAEDTGSWHSRG